MSFEKIGKINISISPKELGKQMYYINANKIYKTILKYKYYNEKINSNIPNIIKKQVISQYIPKNYNISIYQPLHVKEELTNVVIKIEYDDDEDLKGSSTLIEENPFKVYCSKYNIQSSLDMEFLDLNSTFVLKSNKDIVNVSICAYIVGSQVPCYNTRQKIFKWIYNHQVMSIHSLKNFIIDVSKEHNLSTINTIKWIREELQGHDSYNINSYVLNDLCNFLEKNINL